MNPVIEELALQAGGSHYPNVNSMQLIKYTKLVVQECVKVAEGNHGALEDKMLEHFGFTK